MRREKNKTIKWNVIFLTVIDKVNNPLISEEVEESPPRSFWYIAK